MRKRFFAEVVGTLILVLFGCGSAVLAGATNAGQLGISLAFGFSIVAVAYSLGPISGAHLNPAVSLAMVVAGRMRPTEMGIYWSAQFLGAMIGAAILMGIAGGVGHGLGVNGWGPGYLGQYPLGAAALFEVVMTAIFTAVVLGSTGPEASPAFGGLCIGITLAAIHIVGIQVTGVSVNPARSLGPAIFVGGKALAQVWLFLAAPLVGALIGGLLYRALYGKVVAA